MYKRLSTVALLLCSMLLSGCIFDNPLTSSPSKSLNTWLLGVWEYKNEKGQLYRATVLPRSSDRYAVLFSEVGSTPAKSKRWAFEAYISRVGSANFLTFKAEESAGQISPGAYTFVHFQVVDQNHVILRNLVLDSPSNATSFELRKEVRARLKERTLYPSEITVWTRVSEVYWSGVESEQEFQPLRTQIE